MNVETGQPGSLADLLRDAKPGERAIPATIIPDPQHPNATTTKAVVLYGPRKPLREVRRELQAEKAAK